MMIFLLVRIFRQLSLRMKIDFLFFFLFSFFLLTRRAKDVNDIIQTPNPDSTRIRT